MQVGLEFAGVSCNSLGPNQKLVSNCNSKLQVSFYKLGGWKNSASGENAPAWSLCSRF